MLKTYYVFHHLRFRDLGLYNIKRIESRAGRPYFCGPMAVNAVSVSLRTQQCGHDRILVRPLLPSLSSPKFQVFIQEGCSQLRTPYFCWRGVRHQGFRLPPSWKKTWSFSYYPAAQTLGSPAKPPQTSTERLLTKHIMISTVWALSHEWMFKNILCFPSYEVSQMRECLNTYYVFHHLRFLKWENV